MFILLKSGRYAGEIHDIEAVSARAMLADGRAEDPYADPAPVEEAIAAAADTPSDIATPDSDTGSESNDAGDPVVTASDTPLVEGKPQDKPDDKPAQPQHVFQRFRRKGHRR